MWFVSGLVFNEKYLIYSESRHMADRMGTKYLQETLNQALYNHIKEKLPGIRSNLQAKKRFLQDQISDLGGLEANPPSRMTQFTK